MDMQTKMQLAIIVSAWFLIGCRFAYRFFNVNLHGKSTFGDILDMTIASAFIVVIWPGMVVVKLLGED